MDIKVIHEFGMKVYVKKVNPDAILYVKWFTFSTVSGQQSP